MDEARPFLIPKREVWEAFKSVKANQGAAGVDGQSIAEFEADLEDNLYKLWNRLSSGSYFPPPVRRVDIPKRDGGGVRPLGIPTVADRVAQEVARRYLEPVLEPVFIPTPTATDLANLRSTPCAQRESAAGATTGYLIWTFRPISVRQGKPGASSGCNSRPGKGNEPPHRESSLGLMEATTWAKRRQSDGRAVTQVKRLSLVRFVRGPTGSKTWKATVGHR